MLLVLDKERTRHLPSYADIEQAIGALFRGELYSVELRATPAHSLLAAAHPTVGIALECVFPERREQAYFSCITPGLTEERVADAFRAYHDDDLERVIDGLDWSSSVPLRTTKQEAVSRRPPLGPGRRDLWIALGAAALYALMIAVASWLD